MIYYPSYTPSKQKFRSMLLFWDSVNLIVPASDQSIVQERINISDVYKINPNTIIFRDPEARYAGWALEAGINDTLEVLIESASTAKTSKIQVDQNGYALRDQEATIKSLMIDQGWIPIAFQKIPPAIQDAVFHGRVAARIGIYICPKTGRILENDAVICNPKIANFILTRMARQASFIEGLPSITFGGYNFMDHLLDGDGGRQPAENILLQYSIDLFVPDNLNEIDAGDFMSVRVEYEGVRREFMSYIRDISGEHNLNLKQSGDAFLQNLTRAREAIVTEFDAATKQIGKKRFFKNTAMTVESVSTIGTAGLGALLGNPIGAMIASGVGLAGGKFANKLSTVSRTPDGRLVSVAMNKAKVERRGSQQPWDAPSYWRQ